jgi:hypothetical protein
MAKDIIKGTPWYMHAAMITSMVLIIASFFIPPYAIVDSSVLAATGELLGGATLMNFVMNIPKYLEAGVKAKISHGATSISVAADEVKDKAEDL